MIDTFSFVPHGDVKVSYSWASQEYTSEDGTKKYKRTRIKPKKTYSLSITGIYETMNKLIDFYSAHHGQADPFYFVYDGIKELCYFSEILTVKQTVSMGTIQEFSCSVALEVDDQVTMYPSPLETDVLPKPYNDFTRSIDWNVQVLEMGKSDRRRKSLVAHEKLNATWSGLKDERDKLIVLFNSHCRVPLTVTYDGKATKVILPDSIEITDKRSCGEIVGYTCTMELELV